MCSKQVAGYVYVFKDDSKLCKIGLSKDPAQRLSSMRCANPRIAAICQISTNDMYRAERKVHKRFAAKRVTGEWFELSAEDLDWLKSQKSFCFEEWYPTVVFKEATQMRTLGQVS